MKPDLRDLLPDVVLFVAVARAKNFSRAAKTLQMSISTLSRRILAFEAKLGAQLLLRSTRRVELTEIGLRYFERCKLVLEAAEEAQMELRGAVEDAKGTLRVSATQDFALLYVKPTLEEVLARYPKIAFELDLTTRPVDLMAEGFDVAIRLGPLPDSQLFARKLGATTMGVYASPAYLESASTPTTPGDLTGHRCLRLRGQAEGSSPWTLMRGTQVVAVDVRGRVVANAMRVLLELAADGLGVTLLGEAFASQAVGEGRLVRVLPEWNTGVDQVHALTPSKLLPSRTKIFLDSLSEHLRAPSRAEAPSKKRNA
jgi:DNA-binding transcriptional LysR family regulator